MDEVQRVEMEERMGADSEGGKTESRWQSWHLSHSEICLELFSTCLKRRERRGRKKEATLHARKKKHTQVLTLCDCGLLLTSQ